MFTVHDIEAWTWSCVEYFTAEDQPMGSQIFSAESNALIVLSLLSRFKEHMRKHFRRRATGVRALKLVDEILQAFRDDHGGSLPDRPLHLWDKKRDRLRDQAIFTTPEDKKAVVKIWERWKDMDSLHQQFWALGLKGTYNDLFQIDRPLTGRRIRRVRRCLLDWLQMQRAGLLF